MQKKLEQDLEEFIDSIKKRETKPKNTENLLGLLSEVILTLDQNAGSRLHQFGFAMRNKGKVEMNTAGVHGADFFKKDAGSHEVRIEHKASTWTKKTNRCQVNWNIPRNADETKMRKKIKEKVGNGGYAEIEIFTAKRELIKKYRIEGAFIEEYFVKKFLGTKSTNCNFGCSRCLDCGEFHRLKELQRLSKMYINGDPKFSWKSILSEKIPSNCGQ